MANGLWGARPGNPPHCSCSNVILQPGLVRNKTRHDQLHGAHFSLQALNSSTFDRIFYLLTSVCEDGGSWRRPKAPGAAELGVPVSRNTKGKNFVADEERQLCRSVIAISQDPIAGNQQKSNSFWDRILVHYNENRPAGERPARSLETKWGLIKHDVSKFQGVYQHMLRTNRSGTSLADVLKKAHELIHPTRIGCIDSPNWSACNLFKFICC